MSADPKPYPVVYDPLSGLQYAFPTGYVNIATGGSGVSSLNTLTGAVTLAAGTNITLTPSGNTITVAASGGAAFVPQIFQVTTTATDTSTSSTYKTTALTQAIALQTGTNKVKITASIPSMYSSNIGNTAAICTLTRDGTDLFGSEGWMKNAASAANVGQCAVYIDSPGDTSSHTYAVKYKNQDNSTTVNFVDGNGSTAVLIIEELN